MTVPLHVFRCQSRLNQMTIQIIGGINKNNILGGGEGWISDPSPPLLNAHPISAAKSIEPNANRVTVFCVAMSRASAMPRAVSTSAITSRPLRRSTIFGSVDDSALGTRTAAKGRRPKAAKSSSCQGVPAPLMRTMTGILVKSHARTCRAYDFAEGSTESSRSKITASAPDVAAFTNRSGRFAGTKRGVRRPETESFTILRSPSLQRGRLRPLSRVPVLHLASAH